MHYLGWEAKWDEWVSAEAVMHRFAHLHQFSTHLMNQETDVCATFPVDTRVLVHAMVPSPRRWREAVVKQVHKNGCAVKVEYYHDGPSKNTAGNQMYALAKRRETQIGVFPGALAFAACEQRHKVCPHPRAKRPHAVAGSSGALERLAVRAAGGTRTA